MHRWCQLGVEVEEAGFTEAKTDVAGDLDHVAVSCGAAAGTDFDAAPLRGVLEHEVNDASDGVRAVLGRGAVAKTFYLPEGDGWDPERSGPWAPSATPPPSQWMTAAR